MVIAEKMPLFANPLEPYEGLSIADLNRYLPALQTADDIQMTADNLREGIFLTDGLTGLSKLPEDSIDLIIADPPEDPWRFAQEKGKQLTLQEFYKWNEDWLKEAHRVLKITGSIYLLCGWRYSGMFHSLLSNIFIVQTRITWRDDNVHDQSRAATWKNQMSDIWFATKTNEFLFGQKSVGAGRLLLCVENEERLSNFWSDIIKTKTDSDNDKIEHKPKHLINRILDASSFKLNYIVDPFMRSGDIGVIAKLRGRRFIGFDTNQDNLLVAMKRIDQT
ncbi:MAG: site-specific DNA-methyltransferase [Candidatus Marinimicrobia bacterium]|nr:site-specific DNA-methyltransferase [Candidatus Neomarinimicrobiota bacterium]